MAAGNLQALQAEHLLPPEHLGKVRHRAISHTSIPALLGGLLSKGEASQLALHPQLTKQQRECCLRFSRNRGDHRYERLACPDLLLLHPLVRQVGQPPR